MNKATRKQLTFVKQNSPWRIIVPAIGLIAFFSGILLLKESTLGKLLQSLGILLLFIPYFIPFKFRNVVRFSKKGVNFKLDTGSTKAFRFSQIKYLEAFDDHLIIWKSKKKSVKIDVSPYHKEDVNRFIDLMQPQPAEALPAV